MAGPPQKKQKLDLSEEYVVVVGEAQKTFTVSKCFLTKSSAFLETCCKGPWQESGAKRIELSTVKSDQFETYLQFLYTTDLVIEERNGDDTENATEDDDQIFIDHISQLIDLATLGDFLCDLAFSNAVNDAFICTVLKYNVLPGPNQLHTLVKAFSPFSKLYELNVAFFVASGIAEDFKRRGSRYPRQFVLDVLVEMMKRRDDGEFGSEPKWEDRCRYHQHDEKVPFSAESCSDDLVGSSSQGTNGNERRRRMHG